MAKWNCKKQISDCFPSHLKCRERHSESVCKFGCAIMSDKNEILKHNLDQNKVVSFM